jgi:outer membrane receptor protein involved in Fe transport
LLNPFQSFADIRNIRTGNPGLLPEYTDSYELGYLMNKEKTNLYAGAYYRRTTGVIEYITDVDETGISYIYPINLSVRNSSGFESNLSVDPLKWWTLSGDINLFRSITNGNYNGEELNSDDYSWNMRLNSMMKLPQDFDLQTTFFYRAPQRTTQGIREEFYNVNLALSKDIIKGKGTLTLNFRDLFNTRKFSFILDKANIYSVNEFRWQSRTISLSFVFRLNQLKKNNNQPGGNNEFGNGEGMGI